MANRTNLRKLLGRIWPRNRRTLRSAGMRMDSSSSLYGFVWRLTARGQMVVVLMSALVIPLTIAPLEIQRRAVDLVVARPDIDQLAWLISAYVTVALAHVVFLYGLNMQEGRIHESVARRLRQHLTQVLRQRKTPDDVNARGGTLVTVFTSEVDPVGAFAGQAVSVPLVEGGILLSVIGYMIFTEPLLAGVALVFFVPQFIIVPILQERINRQTSQRIQLLRKCSEESLKFYDDDADGKFSFIPFTIRKAFQLRMVSYRLKYLMKYSVLFLLYSSRIAVLGVGIYMVFEGRTEIGIVVAFLSGLERLSARWSDLVNFFRQMSDARLKYELISDILDIEPRPR